MSPQSESPTPRVTASPPGHARSTPMGWPLEPMAWPSLNPAAATRFCSLGESISRCDVPSSLYPASCTSSASESPAFQQQSSERVRLSATTVSVEPEVVGGERLRISPCIRSNTSIAAAFSPAELASAAVWAMRSSTRCSAYIEASLPPWPSATRASSTVSPSMTALTILYVSSPFFEHLPAPPTATSDMPTRQRQK